MGTSGCAQTRDFNPRGAEQKVLRVHQVSGVWGWLPETRWKYFISFVKGFRDTDDSKVEGQITKSSTQSSANL